MKNNSNDGLTLYGYWRSSASYRVRIALNLKSLTYTQVPVHLVKQGGEQHNPAFRAINPQGLVPVLQHDGHIITQSLAICEYLDEVFPQTSLLPQAPVMRARIRSLALQISCEIHPLNNLRVQHYLKEHSGGSIDTLTWMSHWMQEGFAAIERQLGERELQEADFFTHRPGLFECLLVPQVYNAERFDIDLSDFPQITRIVKRCRALPAFIAAAPENQADAQ